MEIEKRFAHLARSYNRTSHIIVYCKRKDVWTIRFQSDVITLEAPTLEQLLSKACVWILENHKIG